MPASFLSVQVVFVSVCCLQHPRNEPTHVFPIPQKSSSSCLLSLADVSKKDVARFRLSYSYKRFQRPFSKNNLIGQIRTKREEAQGVTGRSAVVKSAVFGSNCN